MNQRNFAPCLIPEHFFHCETSRRRATPGAMRIPYILLMISFGTFFGCASIHDGNKTAIPSSSSKSVSADHTTDLGLYISGAEQEEFSSEYFTLVKLVFENKSSKWVSIRDTWLEFGNKALSEKISFPIGHQLAAWSSATQEKLQIEQANRQEWLGAFAAAGALTTVASDDRALKAAGLGVLGTAATISAVSMSSEITRQKISQVVPQSHLFAGGFEIPPGLHAKRWVVLCTERPYEIPYLRGVRVHYRTTDGVEESVDLVFRRSPSPSNWQRDHEARYAEYLKSKKAG